MDSKQKLKRFCFLGSFEPVYVHLRGSLKVETYWPVVSELVKDINDSEFLPFIKELLHDVSLVRRDETLFVYAAYFASTVDIQWKTAMRHAFPVLIRTDDDLFLFCKYASLIGKDLNHKGFSRTVRKAVTAWYEMQTPEAIRTMWLAHRGLHGFTHKALIKLCHIPDRTIGSAEVVTPFFKTCTELIKEAEASAATAATVAVPPATSNTGLQATNANETEMVTVKTEVPEQKPLVKANSTESATPTSVVVAISKLRTTKKKHEAIKIIRKFKLPYTQVPGHLLRNTHPVIMEAVLPTMSYLQILKCWRKMARFNHFDNPKILKICQKMLENKEFAKKSRVHPVHLLMSLRDIGVSDLSKIPTKRVEALKLEYLDKLYKDSFHWNTDGGNLRMHITVNLQSNYKKKMLKNHKRLSYYDACLALSFGYSKRESKVDVFYWYEDKMKLKKILFEKTYSTQLGFTSYDVVENQKNNQRLVTPILNALSSEQVYDVFLCIVPTAGRGNPKQNSDFLCKFLDKYRETKNPNAKFIILNLLKHKRSMNYSETRSENILEICGLDEHTTDIIHNFANNRFE
ncbi:60 kDa SS-A/Ro ribonucleoprotein [Lucilia cuprina]|nr:60 kDa SS-A/Ro ribonucleoprotein [Lucilia cuprina]